MTRWHAFGLVCAVIAGGVLTAWLKIAATEGRAASAQAGAALLIRAPDGRCWRAHGAAKYSNRVLSWRTDGGTTIHVRGTDWIEVARGGGVNGQGLDWRAAAATLGGDLGACLPVAGSAP